MWFRLSEPLSICGESARAGRTVEVQRLAGFIDIHERLSFYRFLCWTISVQLNYPDWCKSNTIKNSYEVNGSVPTCDWLDWKSTSTTCSPSRPTRRSRLTASGKLDLRFERWFRNTFSWFNNERKHDRNVFFVWETAGLTHTETLILFPAVETEQYSQSIHTGKHKPSRAIA